MQRRTSVVEIGTSVSFPMKSSTLILSRFRIRCGHRQQRVRHLSSQCSPAVEAGLRAVMQRIHGEMQELHAPELVRDYHRWMGGVDVHDQLRMQRYSVQLAYKSRKYYRTLFLGLLDMALENSFIVHRYYRKVNNKSPVKHFAFMEDLMEQLLAVDSTEAFGVILEAATARERTAASPAQARSVSSAQVGHLDNEHRLEENPDTVDDSEEDGKKRHRTCKVCAFYKTKSSKFTKYFCPGCSKRDRRKYLCNVPREGRSDTCFTVWHTTWNNGNDIPAELLRGHKARERPPASRPGKKRRRAGGARELLLGGDEAGEAGNDEE